MYIKDANVSIPNKDPFSPSPKKNQDKIKKTKPKAPDTANQPTP